MVQQAIVAQDKVLRKIADAGSCLIVGRAADYVLREYENIIKIFIYAPVEYRVQRVMQVYGDSLDEAQKQVRRSDEARAAYYKNISGQSWGQRQYYDLLIDGSIGIENSAEIICSYVLRATSKKQ